MLDAITQFLNVIVLTLITKVEPLFHTYKALGRYIFIFIYIY